MDNFQIIHFNHPTPINNLSFLDIGKNKEVVNTEFAETTFKKAFENQIYSQLNKLFTLAKNDTFPLAFFSISFLETLKTNYENVYDDVKKLVENGKIELIGSLAYHSFSYLCSFDLFKFEAELYLKELKKHFKRTPKIFINTACLYDDQVAEIIQKIGYKGIIATANAWHLDGKHSGQVYQSNTSTPFNILLSNGDDPDQFQISLINGYGSAYNSELIDDAEKNANSIEKWLFMDEDISNSVYSVSLPLSSPSWQYRIPEYTNSPLQKALLRQIEKIVAQKFDLLKIEDRKTLVYLCQPNHLLKINEQGSDDSYEHFISSMNWLTSISLKYPN